ncbi:MAG: hypothetical protein GX633_05440 [Clostridiales bacterium]|nr:hypothetical protein [Clostridiales bacterium]
MTLLERVAYLKGLAQGLGMDPDKKESKIINAIIDVLDELALSVTDIEDDIIAIGDELDAIDEDLTALEDDFYEDEDEDDEYFDREYKRSGSDDEEDFFELECPGCGEKVYIDDDVIEAGEVECPKCKNVLELHIADECCDCGSEDCEDCGKDE